MEKPTSEIYRPELTFLPDLSRRRRILRWIIKGFIWLIVRILFRISVVGREYFPKTGPMLMVSNHLGDADGIVGLAICKTPFDLLGKVELFDIPVFGKLLNVYGTIWVHRGRADRRALRAALDGLAENRMVAIAPEGRESITGALEEGTNGAAYIALKADVPVLPVVFTGTENKLIYQNLKKFRRSKVTVSAGPPFRLQKTGDRKVDIQNGTEVIMQTLAKMLPANYRGVYRQD